MEPIIALIIFVAILIILCYGPYIKSNFNHNTHSTRGTSQSAVTINNVGTRGLEDPYKQRSQYVYRADGNNAKLHYDIPHSYWEGDTPYNVM
jgi:hypothetical protein